MEFLDGDKRLRAAFLLPRQTSHATHVTSRLALLPAAAAPAAADAKVIRSSKLATSKSQLRTAAVSPVILWSNLVVTVQRKN